MLTLISILFSMILVNSQLTSTNVGSTLSRWDEFILKLTTSLGSNTRAVNSEGGAAGGVVSEGQGYGIFYGAATAASLGRQHTRFADVVTKTYEIWNGWKKMCSLSTGSGNCQTPGLCSGSPCLPHWKFNNALTGSLGTGSAPDGDEDAFLGMIILVRLLDPVKSQYPYWNELAEWTYQTGKQFLTSSTVTKTYGGVNYRIVKLGSCWGGWDCNNPSYHAPAAYRAMRDYMVSYGNILNHGSEGTTLSTQWNDLIMTSYATLSSSQCATNGLLPNWYVPNNNPTDTGTTGCSGSGTPSGQYGAEASRSIWRVALDYAVYPESSTNSGAFLSRTVKHLNSIYSNGNWGNLATGCLVTSVFDNWLGSDNAFIYAPTFTSLIYPEPSISATQRQTLINSAASKIATGTITKYYSGSWTAIATLTINGDISVLKSVLGAKPSPPVVAAPVAPPTRTPTPTPTPVTPVTTTCSYAKDYTQQNWYVEVDNIISTATVKIVCDGGRTISCVYYKYGDYGKYQCDVAGQQCLGPRVALVNGVCCSLDKSCVGFAESDTVALEQPANNDQNIWLGVGCGVGVLVLFAIVVIIGILHKKRNTTETV